MLLNIKIDNLKGIEKEIEVSFLASNKIKRSPNKLSHIEKQKNVLKNIGIIGSNGSGKTSFINSIMAIQTFITFPFRKSYNEDNKFIEQIKKFPEEMIKELLKGLNTLKLPEQNVYRSNEPTNIEIEMYVPPRKDNISGIYVYKLAYDNKYNSDGVKKESLSYRETYSTNKEKIIFETFNNIESELGTSLLYENNVIKQISDAQEVEKFKTKMKYYKSFGKEIMNNLSFSFNNDEIDLNHMFKNNINRFKDLCKLADEKIINVTLDKDEINNKEKLYFWLDNKHKLNFNQLSKGTKKIILLGNKIFETIENNSLLIIDELESALHPQLANLLVLLMSENSTDNFAQLIFTTHSPWLIFTLYNDQIIYIDNKEKYNFNSINKAINNNIISKDKNPKNALFEGLLIKNPNFDNIQNFISKYNKLK